VRSVLLPHTGERVLTMTNHSGFATAFCVLLLVAGVTTSFAQPNRQNEAPLAQVSAEKRHALDWLSRDDVRDQFGRIADAIWSYAELGMHEYKSSAVLIDALQREGFTVDKGLAGMPTCFVASYGSGKPVIGILAEYDALPMVSQKAFTVDHDPVVEGGPGHGCGHNMMGPAAAAAAIAVKKAMQVHGLPGTIK
jgi:aminobenzoyl-glutamate utilization protein B